MPARCMIGYASAHGHTRRIAERIAARLRRHDLEVDLVDLREHDPSPEDHALVLVAGSVHAGHHHRELTDWLRTHAEVLAGTTTALVSVSLSAADDDPEARETARGYVAELCEATGLRPTIEIDVAGALQYREYGVATRILMRLIARRNGLPTDPVTDVDYTDWDAVDRFAGEAAALALAARPTAASGV